MWNICKRKDRDAEKVSLSQPFKRSRSLTPPGLAIHVPGHILASGSQTQLPQSALSSVAVAWAKH